MNEADAIKRIKNGDIEAFEDIVALYETKVCGIIYQIVRNQNEVEDIAQEVFIKVFKNINKFEEKSSLYTWIYRITVNMCIDTMKKRKSVVYIDEKLETGDGEIERQFESDQKTDEIYEKKELKDIIKKCIEELPEKQRMMIILRDIKGFSYEEISSFTKTNIGTVKSQINRARLKLKELLEKKGTIVDYVESKD